MFDELSAPMDFNRVDADAKTPAIAAELYAASLVAIDADTPAEKASLQMLAARLNLPSDLLAHLHAAAGAAPLSAAALMRD